MLFTWITNYGSHLGFEDDYTIPSVICGMEKFIIWIVEDSRELTKACRKYAVDKVFQNDGNQSCWPETLHQG